ncbi:hypothetical protein QL285_088947 [Trifolium repens]|nr:hypothetical protein QL285_088947 [Trifolium repens]
MVGQYKFNNWSEALCWSFNGSPTKYLVIAYNKVVTQTSSLVSTLTAESIFNLSSVLRMLSHHPFNWPVKPITIKSLVLLSLFFLILKAVAAMAIFWIMSKTCCSEAPSIFHSTILSPE